MSATRTALVTGSLLELFAIVFSDVWYTCLTIDRSAWISDPCLGWRFREDDLPSSSAGRCIISQPVDRRNFLKSVAAGGTIALTTWPVSGTALVESAVPSEYKVLTPAQVALVEAIAEQFVPADNYSGGRAAGVASYIDGILAGHFGKFYKDRYEQGLNLVDEISRKQFARSFVSLASERQITILTTLESGAGTGGTDGRQFFALILQHTMEAYYGSAHDDGTGGTGWKMIGFQG
jgi:hypothetical protein